MKIKSTIVAFWLLIGNAIGQPSVSLFPYAQGFTGGITNIVSAGDSRLFVTEQLGYISIVDSAGNVLPNYFLDISSKVTPTIFTPGDEQGLLGLAFSPNYENDGFFYVNYTNKSGIGNTIISRFHVSSNPSIADVNSEEVLLNIFQPYSNHNGGALVFGNDGFLYCALGDGGDAGDPGNRAQNTDSLLGKILRIDVSGPSGYAIPPSNPFALGGGAPEIWAYGLRNPWKISFDRATHDLIIADVGQFEWEEINVQLAGALGGSNYGWRCLEGNHPYDTVGCGPLNLYVPPVFEYSHLATNGCAITGGYVYRGNDYPDLTGYYFFSDYCTGDIYVIDTTLTGAVAGNFPGNNFTAFGENNTGELFIGSQSNGTVYKIFSTVTALDEYSEEALDINIYPNPVQDVVNCDIGTSAAANAEIEIADLTGRICYKTFKKLVPGINTLSFEVGNVAAGSYILSVKTASGNSYRQLEILK